ncbi:MAG: AraC family transcriptional regulator [Pseudonocardia sp.]|nr:AraC family transcriptional regulator [Pseudonocardia sp.]
MTEVLSGYRRVCSVDLDEARDRVGEVFCPHRLEPAGHGYRAKAGAAGAVRFNSTGLGAVGLSYLAYGMDVRIRPQPLSSFFLVQIPLRGRALVRSGGREVVSDTTVASIPDPDRDLDMTWGAGNEQLIVRVDRSALQTQLHRLLGRSPSKPLRLATALDLTSPAGRSWLATVEMLRADLDGPGGLRHSLLAGQTEQLVMSQLLAAVPHSASDELDARAGNEASVLPRVIRRAAQLIDDHAREDLTVEDVAEAVGLSVRSLQEGFRRHLDTTPTARLRNARLAGVHAQLADADSTRCTVSELAADWGFHHLGRFAVAYKRRFGQSPSVTLRA